METIETNSPKTIDWYEVVDQIIQESTNPYYTDIFSPWETKEQLRIWKEVKDYKPNNKYCLSTWWTTTLSYWWSAVIWITTYTWNDTWMQTWSNRITITQTWVYTIFAWWYWNSSACWEDMQTRLVSNWSTILAWEKRANDSSYTIKTTISWWWLLTVWDYIEYQWVHNCWSSRTFTLSHFNIIQAI